MSEAGSPDTTTRTTVDQVREDLWYGESDPERAARLAAEAKAAKSAAMRGLRPFPEVAEHVMSLLGDPNVKVRNLTEALERDPALAAGLMRVANSPVYTSMERCKTIEHAVMRLGFNSVRQILSAVVALALFEDSGEFGARIREHCAGVATIARVIGFESKFAQTRELFLAALVHDVGKLLAAQAKDCDYTTFPDEAFITADEFHLHERRVMGYDHAVLGAAALEKWRFASEITQVVALHHQPARAYQVGGTLARSVAILRISDRLEYAIEAGREPDEQLTTELAKDPAWTYVGLSPAVLTAMWPKLVAATQELLSVLTTSDD